MDNAVVQIAADMLPIEGGSILLGAAPGDREPFNEAAAEHLSTVSAFQLCRYPVTQAQWLAIMGDNLSRFRGGECPVENVSWDDAQAFIARLNAFTGKSYRLPTEAEWEFAARGGNLSKGYTYAGSNVLDEVGWYEENSNMKTHPVGRKQANELGLYDMSGNVCEWCAVGEAERLPQSDAPADLASDALVRILRGGSWLDTAGRCTVAFSYSVLPDYRRFCNGFRLAHPVL